MFTLIIFFVVLGIIVLFHEFGHFITAKKSGMATPEFGFGFPPRIFGVQKTKSSWRFVRGNRELNEEDFKHGTVYSINWLPLGGFVKIKGEEGEDESTDSFLSAKFGNKILVTIAGVLMNIVLAILLLSLGYLIGLPEAVAGLPKHANIQNKHLEIVQVLKNKPADSAEIKIGDVVLSIGDIKEPSVEQMQNYIDNNRNAEIKIVLKRKNEILEKSVKPIIYEDTGKGGIGVGLSEVAIVKYPWYLALWEGVVSTALYLKAILFTFILLIKGLFTGSAGVAAESVSGPVGIAVMTGQVARLGFAYLLQFTALLSLNLAVLNILPLPALDGGRLIFLIIGKITGKQRGLKYEQIAHSLGFLLLIGLVIFVSFKDVLSFFR